MAFNIFYPVTSLYSAVGRLLSAVGASMVGESSEDTETKTAETATVSIDTAESSAAAQKLKEAEAKIAELQRQLDATVSIDQKLKEAEARAAKLQMELDTAVVSGVSLPPSPEAPPSPPPPPPPPPPPLGIPKVAPPLGEVGQRFGSVLDEITKAHVLKDHTIGKIEKLVEQDGLLKMITEGRGNLGKKKDGASQESAIQGSTGKSDISSEMRRLLISKNLAEARVKGAKEKSEKTNVEIKRIEKEIVALEKIKAMSSVGESSKESRTRLEDAEGKLRAQAIALEKARQKQATEKVDLEHQEKLLEAQEKKIVAQKEKEAKIIVSPEKSPDDDDDEFQDAVEHASWEPEQLPTPRKL